ncbi:hypothetical protein IFM89_021786 [Coptis chinensis]|uniref:Uncharacterized protein n=1 Tax=Coptis chinensis TaxID=261450 RepID=A0A835ISI1_9MAGN|nr:hypothetical protein IFM89_021786 [Coptis chinensis]
MWFNLIRARAQKTVKPADRATDLHIYVLNKGSRCRCIPSLDPPVLQEDLKDTEILNYVDNLLTCVLARRLGEEQNLVIINTGPRPSVHCVLQLIVIRLGRCIDCTQYGDSGGGGDDGSGSGGGSSGGGNGSGGGSGDSGDGGGGNGSGDDGDSSGGSGGGGGSS